MKRELGRSENLLDDPVCGVIPISSAATTALNSMKRPLTATVLQRLLPRKMNPFDPRSARSQQIFAQGRHFGAHLFQIGFDLLELGVGDLQGLPMRGSGPVGGAHQAQLDSGKP